MPRLSGAEREAFYADMRRFGTYFGLPADFGPRTWEEFCRYRERMLADRRMGATATSRAMAWAVAAPVRPWWLRLMGPPARFAFTEVLPSPVRERLGFRRTLWTRAAMTAVGRLLPRVVPLLPPRLRYCPQYLAARERLGRGEPGRSGRETPEGMLRGQRNTPDGNILMSGVLTPRFAPVAEQGVPGRVQVLPD